MAQSTLTDRFAGTPDTVNEGATLPITYTNASLAGQTIEIEIDNGTSDPIKREMTLDEEGVGHISFQVPSGWLGVNINGPDSEQHVVTVNP